MKRWGVLMAVAACAFASRAAHAGDDDRFEIGASFVVASTAPSMDSGGMLGGAVTAARWFGPIAIVGEAGYHDWDYDGGARWAGAGVRVAHTLATRDRKTNGLLWCRLWAEAGLAEKKWDLKASYLDSEAWYTGPRLHAGGGIDLGGGNDPDRGHPWSMAMSMWFRVEWGPTPDLDAAPAGGWHASFYDPVPAKDYVMGMAFLFGGPA
jgi:hypothetical protein